jgi:isopentenyl-diphosphate Delta-isomerase
LSTKDIYIPLVNEADEIIGHEEKMEIHLKGLLHRAFSILVFNSDNQILIHQRAFDKYHCGGLWTNTCCGHPNQAEPMEHAIHRRLKEEMGFDCILNFAFKFHYRTTFDNGLVENEIDHVYVGTYDSDFSVNTSEVAAFKWVSLTELKNEIESHPQAYTVWFKEILNLQSYFK